MSNDDQRLAGLLRVRKALQDADGDNDGLEREVSLQIAEIMQVRDARRSRR